MAVDRRCTYRLQLSPDFDLRAAGAVVPYLADLGVSHLYLSPVFEAVPESPHGYDVVDPTRVREEIGGDSAFLSLAAAVRAHGMGLLVDMVTNHMAIGRHNRWWWDVLSNGRNSESAVWFDVWWDSPLVEAGRLLLPVLGAPLDEVIAAGDLLLGAAVDGAVLRYWDQEFPVHAGEAGPPDTVDVAASDPHLLAALLEHQEYVLTSWRDAADHVNYRRFFDVNAMTAVRVENRAVFETQHSLVRRWFEDGIVDGLRIDHVDGLLDPAEYLQRLRTFIADGWILVEKILEWDERIPHGWPCDGTTGYDFLERVSRLLCDPAGEAELLETWRRVSGDPRSWDETVGTTKHDVLDTLFGADVRRLADPVIRICAETPGLEDRRIEDILTALREVLAGMRVYRTYTRPGRPVTGVDTRRIREAVAVARERHDDESLLTLIEGVLCGESGDLHGPAASAEEARLRFQQTSGAVMAKGVEDTAMYRWLPLVSRNEVGADPSVLGLSPDEFHRRNQEVLAERPHTLLTTSTHDTKRSEDVRARLHALSEIPGQWGAAVDRWRAHNARYRGASGPSGRAEYLLYQTLVGAWPIDADRAVRYLIKAEREAKAETSWLAIDSAYEAALEAFVRGALDDRDFLADFGAFLAPVVEAGRVTSLSQKLLALTCPGVPDVYNGTELWDLRLVDPDNRAPVDFETRRRMLAELDTLVPDEILARSDGGLPKLHVVRTALDLRRRRAPLFGPESSYEPLMAAGEAADRVVAFCRGGGAVTVVPRFPLTMAYGLPRGLLSGWGDTHVTLPAGRWRNLLGGGEAEGATGVGALLGAFPVALLEAGPASNPGHATGD